MKTKICSKCKKRKNTNCFNASKTAKDGLYSQCKECRTKRGVELGRIKRLAKNGGKLYYNNSNVDGIAYFTGDCEICGVSFLKTLPRQVRCHTCGQLVRDIHRLLSTIRKIGGEGKRVRTKPTIPAVVDVSKRFLYAQTCVYCNRRFTKSNPKTLDHITPVSLGGTNESNNIAIACRECNECKARLTLEQWISLCRIIAAIDLSCLRNESTVLTMNEQSCFQAGVA